MFKAAGFNVKLLEYSDEEGNFHYKEWDKNKVYFSIPNVLIIEILMVN